MSRCSLEQVVTDQAAWPILGNNIQDGPFEGARVHQNRDGVIAE